MNIRSLLHNAATAWALTLLAVAASVASSCDRGYEPPPIQPSDHPDTPGGSGNGGSSGKPGDDVDAGSSGAGEPVAPAGRGTREDPYNIAALRALPEDEEDIWVVGYVGGFVAGRSFDDGIRFRLPQDGDDYEGGNLVLGCSPDTRLCSESAPVILWGPFRRSYSLTVRPDLLGRRVLLNGASGILYGVRGLADISIFLVLDEESPG